MSNNDEQLTSGDEATLICVHGSKLVSDPPLTLPVTPELGPESLKLRVVDHLS